MVIKNSTIWSTSDLRLLFRRCIKEVEKVEKPNWKFHTWNKNYQLDILNGQYFRGRAVCPRNGIGLWMMIKIPKTSINRIEEKEEIGFKDKEMLARLIIHEYYHNLGYRNWDKNNYRGDLSKKWNVDWVKDYPVTKKEVIKKEPINYPMVRYQKAIINLRKAETRLKRAKTLHSKWKTKVKYYQDKYNYKP